jgi:hypothetical protein
VRVGFPSLGGVENVREPRVLSSITLGVSRMLQGETITEPGVAVSTIPRKPNTTRACSRA